jgi:hypothetical protein
MSVQDKIKRGLAGDGYAELSALELPQVPELVEAREQFAREWFDLPQDAQMGDGGTYRYRRFSRMRLTGGELVSLEGEHGIYQSLHDNPLNGGRLRFFESLTASAAANPYLHWLIGFDAACLPESADWTVGVHMIRIEARSSTGGLPTPEGVHLDGEAYTVQHLVARENVQGGVFSVYDRDQHPCFHWLQLRPWDSVWFTGQTWHSATPIYPRDDSRVGYRDIVLVDFEPTGN